MQEEPLHLFPRVNIGTIGSRAFHEGGDSAFQFGLADAARSLVAAICSGLLGGQEGAVNGVRVHLGWYTKAIWSRWTP